MTYPDPDRCPCGCDVPLCRCNHYHHTPGRCQHTDDEDRQCKCEGYEERRREGQ